MSVEKYHFKYRLSDGEIIAMNSGFISSAEGEGVIVINTEPLDKISHYRIVGGGIVVKTAQEIEQITNQLKVFTPENFLDFVNSGGVPDISKITNLAEAKTELALIVKRQDKIIKALSIMAKFIKEREVE